MNKIRGAMRAIIVNALARSSYSRRTAPKQPPPPMNFFLTSVGIGKGGDLGGSPAPTRTASGSLPQPGPVTRLRHALPSTQAADGKPAVNARDRIGAGPWYNAKGGRVAKDLADLHGDTLDAARIQHSDP